MHLLLDVASCIVSRCQEAKIVQQIMPDDNMKCILPPYRGVSSLLPRGSHVDAMTPCLSASGGNADAHDGYGV